ncbi:response regulator [Eleftheria terrae]|uniref:response regulator n=1 Tax=Eleftheria terrae TaxID=1597781 RepID=UPI00263AEB9C|nr:response regulator [Eleftheria terrae]WKB51990.1 response regulator [Eleftheria terrae]
MATADAPPLRILVVDDCEAAAGTLAQLLTLLGHETQVAPDGEQALQAVERWRPDCVLLDLALPRLGGLEVARRLRLRATDRPLLLIALSGWTREEDRLAALQAGCDHHLAKPVDFERLCSLLQPNAPGAGGG